MPKCFRKHSVGDRVLSQSSTLQAGACFRTHFAIARVLPEALGRRQSVPICRPTPRTAPTCSVRDFQSWEQVQPRSLAVRRQGCASPRARGSGASPASTPPELAPRHAAASLSVYPLPVLTASPPYFRRPRSQQHTCTFVLSTGSSSWFDEFFIAVLHVVSANAPVNGYCSSDCFRISKKKSCS